MPLISENVVCRKKHVISRIHSPFSFQLTKFVDDQRLLFFQGFFRLKFNQSKIPNYVPNNYTIRSIRRSSGDIDSQKFAPILEEFFGFEYVAFFCIFC
jgi:hypothetical protein